jgi:hypothetical protein
MTRVLALLVAAGVLTCALEPATVRAAAGEGQDLNAICIPVLGATSLSLLTAALPAAGIGLTCAELGHWPVASVALRSEGCCSASIAPVVRCAVWNASSSAKDTS